MYFVLFNADGVPTSFSGLEFPGAELVEIDHKTLETCRRVNGEWVAKDPELNIEPTPPEPNSEDLEEERKFKGIEFEGVMCSATKEDQDGLAAVILAIQLQGSSFKPTMFHFSNGSKLVISLANYQALADVWLPFRQSFFKVS